jgi:Tol biopolymer transport system component
MIVPKYRAAPLAACLMVSCATMAHSQAQTPSPTSPLKAPITHEKLWMMKRVAAPAVSPDGKWVIFSVLEPSYEADKDVSDLWITAADGSTPPRRLTNTKAAEGAVAWSADSRNIAFTTKREGDEAEQIYILDLASGGEARLGLSERAG